MSKEFVIRDDKVPEVLLIMADAGIEDPAVFISTAIVVMKWVVSRVLAGDDIMAKNSKSGSVTELEADFIDFIKRVQSVDH